MKRPSRNIEIFSMSALDLFASGFGAFIVLAIVLMPYFPNEGSSPEQVEVLMRRINDLREEVAAARDRISVLERAVDDRDRQIADLQRAAGERERQIADLQRAAGERERQIADLQRAAGERERQIADLQRAAGDREREIADLRRATAERERQIADLQRAAGDRERQIADLQRRAAAAQLPDFDLVIAIDVTRSMRDQIDALKEESQELVQVLSRLAPSAGIGIVAFGDRTWGADVTRSHPITEVRAGSTGLTQILNFINGLSISFGNPQLNEHNRDGPEAVGAALQASIRMQWRTVATRRIIVVITDNPAYPEEIDSTLQAAVSFASIGGGRVSAVFVDTWQGEDSPSRNPAMGPLRDAAVTYLRTLATRGRGRFVESGRSMTATLLLAMLD